MRVALLIAVGVVALAYGLVTRMPAAFVANWADTNIPGLTLSGAAGTALDGHIKRVLYRDLPLQDIAWQIHPWFLLLGKAQVDIRIATDAGGIDAGFRYPLLGGDVVVTNLNGSASFDWLAQRAGYTFIPVSGRLGLDLERIVLSPKGQISAVTGQATANNIRWQLIRPPALLGRLGVAITSETGTITAKVTDSDGPLAVKGSVALTANNIYQLNIRLRARSGAEPRLKRLLSELGDANANGWYRIHTQGAL